MNTLTLSYNFSAHLNLSAAGSFQGAKLFSMLENMLFHEAGACDSSMILNLRSCTIMSNGSMFTGQASTQALQVVHAMISSADI